MKGVLISLVAFAAWAFLLPVGAASARRVCVDWEVRTEDSGTAIPSGPNAGDVEDKYSSADNGSEPSALGVRIKISRSGWNKTYDTEPGTGCVTWNDDNGYSGSYSVRVYGYQTDANDNYVRIHAGTGNTCGPYPGLTYSYLALNYTPSSGTDHIAVGDELARWTTQAMLGFGLYRYHDGISDKAIHSAFHTSAGCGSSAHYGASNDFITAGRHCMRIAQCGFPDHTRLKFVVGHELGHALAALHYGDKSGAVNGTEPGSDSSWSGTTDDSTCEDAGSYDIDDVEWSSIAFREGFAHFLSGRMFNDRTLYGSTNRYEGAFTWLNSGTSEDLQRPEKGGFGADDSRYDDLCCVSGGSCASGTGIIGDWHRFFWDWYSNQGLLGSCTTQPSKVNMLFLYTQTRREGGLTRSNYFSKMQAGAATMTGIPACLRGTMLNTHAAVNGIDQ